MTDRLYKFVNENDTIVKVWSEPIPYDEVKTSLLNSLRSESDE